jgi:sec-independent protein translocase protein TatA
MGSFSIWHWIIVLVIVLLLFGAGKLPSVMGDLAKGVKAFKSGMKDEEDEKPTPPPSPTIQHDPVPPVSRPGTTAGLGDAPRPPGQPPQA